MTIKNGLHFDLSDRDYHGQHQALSASGAKLLLPPSCPAKFKWALDNPRHSDAFDFGTVAHRLILGKGSEIVPLDYDSFRTKDAKAAQAAVRAEGKTPILANEYDRAVDLAAAVNAHPEARLLFSDGEPEVSAFWTDEETGIQRRARFDWLRNVTEGRRLLIGDLKTARSSEPTEFGKACADYGYAIQAANYIDAVRALDLDPDPAFLFVAVEKEPPYVVTVGQLDDDSLAVGRYLLRKAIRLFAECVERDDWPGYAQGVTELSLPYWFTNRHEEAFTA